MGSFGGNQVALLSAAMIAVAGIPVQSVAGSAPPVLPSWPCSTVATLKFSKSEFPYSFLAANLDGKAGDELVTLASAEHSSDQAMTLVSVYGWRNGFQRLTRSSFRVASGMIAGDVDQDGRDELYATGADNAFLTYRLQGGQLRVTHRQILTEFGVVSHTVSDVRRKASPELILAVDSRKKYNSEGEPNCDLLLGYQWTQGKWAKTWQQKIIQKAVIFELHSGSFTGAGRRELVFEHGPSDVSVALFDAWHWNGSRLVKRASYSCDAETASGLQSWFGIADVDAAGAEYIAADTTYLIRAQTGDQDITRGELLRWTSKGVQKAFRLPGRPVVVGRFTRVDRAGILVFAGSSGFSLLEPRNTQKTRLRNFP